MAPRAMATVTHRRRSRFGHAASHASRSARVANATTIVLSTVWLIAYSGTGDGFNAMGATLVDTPAASDDTRSRPA